MVGCSAPNCSSRSDRGIRHFAFPVDQERKQKWLINCRRDQWTPTSSSRLCEKHFESGQFEEHRADGWKKLKPNAIPTLFSVLKPPPRLQGKRRVLKRLSTNKHHSVVPYKHLREHNYMQEKSNKSVEVGCSSSRSGKPNDDISTAQSDHLSKLSSVTVDRTSSGLTAQVNDPSTVTVDHTASGCSARINDHSSVAADHTFADGTAEDAVAVATQSSPCEHIHFQEQIKVLSRRNKQLHNKIRSLKQQLKRQVATARKFEWKVRHIFSDDQLRVLQSAGDTITNRGRKWSPETVSSSLQLLFACGSAGYKVLRSQGYPLPASRTLRKKLEGFHCTAV